MPVLPGVLHGPVPAGRAEDDQPEGDHSGHAKASPRLPHQLRGDAPADPHRQRTGHPGERQDRAAHHEEHPGRLQSVRAGQGGGDPDRESVLQAQVDVGEEGRDKEQLAAQPPEEDQRAPAEQEHAFPHRRHNVLLRLRADAPPAAHPGGGQVLCRIRDPGKEYSSSSCDL